MIGEELGSRGGAEQHWQRTATHSPATAAARSGPTQPGQHSKAVAKAAGVCWGHMQIFKAGSQSCNWPLQAAAGPWGHLEHRKPQEAGLDQKLPLHPSVFINTVPLTWQSRATGC